MSSARANDSEDANTTAATAAITLTRHKISDRARERAWLQGGQTNYMKAIHRNGTRFAASPG